MPSLFCYERGGSQDLCQLWRETMKTPTDVMDLVRIICDFYNSYRETLGMSHEVARHKVELMYDDLHDWLYPEDEICIGDDPELWDIYMRKKHERMEGRSDTE